MQQSSLLQNQGWEVVEKLPQDGTLRTYQRIKKGDMNALYMDCGPTHGVPLVTRASDFVPIAEWLRSIGLRAPEVYEVDYTNNAAIVEDFGKMSLKQAIANGEDAMALYKTTGEILQVIQNAKCPLKLPQFSTSFMRKARQRFIDWYVPVLRQAKNPAGLVQSYHAMWDEIEKSIGPYNQCFMHVDFHVENLMFIPGETGLNSIGIIDFQEAMFGPESYDLVNLLEDMRADVPLDIQKELLKGKDEAFLAWYRILGTQFHCRLLGQLMRWAFVEDKVQYFQFYPRLIAYVERALHDPILKPFKEWLEKENIELVDASKLDWKACRQFIAEDAV